MTDDADPFGPWQRMVEQFGATGAGNWSRDVPMVPFPMPGAAGSETPATTKQLLRQLYAVMAGATGSSGNPVVDAWEQYADAMNVPTAAGPQQLSAATLSTYRLWFHGIAQVLVESYTIRLLHDRVVDADYRRKSKTQRWLWSLPQSDREQLLLRCAGVDSDLVASMETARQRRDELLYDVSSWRETDFDAPLDDARRYLRVLTALDDLVTEGEGFSFFPAREPDGDGSGEELAEGDGSGES